MINFQFSRFEESPLADIFKFSRIHISRLVLVSVAAGVLGIGIGLLLNYPALRQYRSSQVEAPAESIEPAKEEPKIATYSGTIKPLGPSIYMEGTHFLEDSSGEMTTLLKSRKIDLTFLEGQSVEVEGKLSKTVEGGQTILEVEKVRF